MRIFASWSGKPSREIAIILKDWIPNVLQDVEVYVSSQDISKGERWLNNVNTNLQEHNFGISIVTAENYLAPWILFEAGALAKTLNGRLIPLLCGIDTISMPNHPLTQFQYVVAPGHDELLRFMQDINAACDRPLPDERIKATFEKWYPDFVEAYGSIEFVRPPKESKKADPHLVEEAINEMLREMRDIRASLNRTPGVQPSSARQIVYSKIPEVSTVILDDQPRQVRVRERPWRTASQTAPQILRKKPKADDNSDNS